MAELPYLLIDAFCGTESFTGNPAGVVWSAVPLPDSLMANIAMQLNQAETAFLTGNGPRLGLRWFTPTVEVDLCGHATLASAHALFAHSNRLQGPAVAEDQTIEFDTRSGVLTATLREGGIELDFTDEAPWPEPLPHPLALENEILWTGRNRMDWFVEVADAESLRNLIPPISEIEALRMRGLVVTARSDRTTEDFVSRCFYPQSGIAEDPVTGSAHCALGPYWSAKLGRSTVRGYQASRRGGYVEVEPRGNRCLLRGQARLSAAGVLWV